MSVTVNTASERFPVADHKTKKYQSNNVNETVDMKKELLYRSYLCSAFLTINTGKISNTHAGEWQ